jgi:hypothetical protein
MIFSWQCQVTKGRALMTAQDIAECDAPTNHSLRVNWFHREPGGSTIFAMPEDGDAPARPVAEREDDDATCMG